jgi:hypothetical protein
MGTAKKSPAPSDKVELYDRLVATIPEVSRKGATVPYTSVNGNMFSYLDKSGSMALRLPRQAREAFIEDYGTSLFDSYGIVQKEYVRVPDALLATTEDLQPYFAASHEYANPDNSR